MYLGRMLDVELSIPGCVYKPTSKWEAPPYAGSRNAVARASKNGPSIFGLDSIVVKVWPEITSCDCNTLPHPSPRSALSGSCSTLHVLCLLFSIPGKSKIYLYIYIYVLYYIYIYVYIYICILLDIIYI